MFVEDVSERMSNHLMGPRQSLHISSGKIISSKTFKNMFEGKEALCSSIDINEGRLTTMVLNNSKMIGG
jgi:hypothetical protein